MRVFKFKTSNYDYAFAAETKELAMEAFVEEIGENITSIEEIPEIEWDEPIIEMHEDNDMDSEPFYISIREAIQSDEPHLLFTNDF